MPTSLILIASFAFITFLVVGLLTLLTGRSTESLENRLDVLTGHAAGNRGGAAAVTLLAEPLDLSPSVYDIFFSRFVGLRRLVEQSGVNLSVTKFVLFSLASAGLGAIVSSVVLPWMMMPVGGLIALGFPLVFVLLKRKRRLTSFARQLPEALELISRALRAGHSLAAGINLVADEMPDPIAREFGRCYDEQNLGIPLEQALDEMTKRVPNMDLRFFATAVILQRQTGGDLAEILDKIGHLIRERFKIWGAIQALTGEGRLSGIVLLALPPVLFVVMYKLNPEYCMLLFNDPLGQKMLAGAVVMQFLGAYVIRKIIRIKV